MKKLTKILIALFISLTLLNAFQPAAKAAEKEEITTYAKKMIGVPYQWGGTTPKGFDCSGFMTYVFKEYGIKLPRSSAEQFGQGHNVEKNQLVPGDLVFFTTYKKGPSHSGIYIGNNKFIHAAADGVRTDSLDSSYYKVRYLGAKRYL